MKNLVVILFVVLTINVCGQNTAATAPKSTELENDQQTIKKLIEDYKSSINEANITLAETFWLTSSTVSFINPKGHIKGWEAIKAKVYNMFGTRFSSRDLSTYNETISVYGDMAVVEFYWVFDATFAGDNPTTIKTEGRETQVVKKMDNEWKLVHVHYSNMPVTGEREGF